MSPKVKSAINDRKQKRVIKTLHQTDDMSRSSRKTQRSHQPIDFHHQNNTQMSQSDSFKQVEETEEEIVQRLI